MPTLEYRDVVLDATLDAVGASLRVDVAGLSLAAIQITGTWTGTISFEASLDELTYVPISFAAVATNSSVTSVTSNGVWHANIGGARWIRARMSALSSGAAKITWRVSASPAPDMHSAGGGGDGAVTDGGAASIRATVLDYVASNPLAVRLTDTNGDYVAIGGGGDGAVLDGVTSSIRANVFDYANSNPLAVRLTDTNGDYVAASGGTQYAEDTATAAAEQLTMAGVVRRDAPASGVDLDGDRTQLAVDASGRLWVNGSNVTQPISAASLPLPTGAATETTLAGVKTGTDRIPTSPAQEHTTAASPHATRLSDGAAFYKATTPTDTQPVSAASLPLPAGASQEHVTAASPHAVRLSDGAAFYDGAKTGQLPSALVGGRLDVSVGAALPAGTNNIGDVDVLTLPALPAGTNNIGDVDVLTLPANASINLNQVGGTTVVTGGVVGTLGIGGAQAHDAVDASNPIKTGSRAVAHGASPAAVLAGDLVHAIANRHGVPFILGGHPNVVTLEAAYTAAQTDAAIVTATAGQKIVVTEIEALCDKANTADVGLRVGFGATTTPTTTGVVLTHPGIAAGSGVVRGSGAGILGIGADGEDLRVTSEVPTGGSLRILVTYFIVES